jgi:gamma-glutamyltranspeptidase/glutathione hydrolase
MNIQEAIDAPRFHHQWMPDIVLAEEYAIPVDTQNKLKDWGYVIKPSRLANHLAAIMVGGSRLSEINPKNHVKFGANDPRRNTGSAMGY